MRITLIALCLLAYSTTSSAASISLTAGSLLVQQVALPSLTTSNIEVLSKSGALANSAQVTGTADIAENLTVLNGNLYVTDGAGYVNLINLSNGSVASSFKAAPFGLNGIGSLNGNLLTLAFSSSAVSVYSTSGSLLKTITLSSTPASLSWNGIASDGTTLYLADSTTGRIYQYSTTGAQLGFFTTAAAGGLTGVSFDSSNDSLWITDTLTNQVFDLTTTGSQISQFSLGAFRPGSGIAVVPGPSASSTPEPGYQGVLLLFSLFAFAYRLAKTRINRNYAVPTK
jgi:hypothetical protein